MKDVCLILLMLAMFLFGFFVMKKIDDFIEENQRQIDLENKRNGCQIRIAAESPMLLNSVAYALKYCTSINPYIEFFISSGRAKRLCQKLLDGKLDIVLLAEEPVQDIHNDFQMIKIPYQPGQITVSEIQISVEEVEEEAWVYVLWNKTIASLHRDRVLFTLENDFLPN